jgi:hypothetical protein
MPHEIVPPEPYSTPLPGWVRIVLFVIGVAVLALTVYLSR